MNFINFDSFTLIVPVLNEAETVPQVLRLVSDYCPKMRVLIMDDCSSDGTQAAVQQFANSSDRISVQLCERVGASHRGIAASVIDGIARCESEFFLVMDGDLQHPPSLLPEICQSLNVGNDMVLAIRLPYREDQPWYRNVFTYVATSLAKLHLRLRGIKSQDPMSGFFAGRTGLVKDVVAKYASRFELKGYKILFDILRVIDPSIKISEVAYQFGVRPGGHSKLRPAHAFYFLRSLFR